MKWLSLAKHALFGAICCTHPLLSLLALGWTQRWMRRQSLRTWHARAGEAAPELDTFCESLGEQTHAPNWILGESRERLRDWLRSLGANAVQGLAVALNTAVLVLPGSALWLFSWYAGWNNSFHKGYELAFVGPTLGLMGVAAFIAAMFYVPLAQARQAVCGEWRSFWDFATVQRLVRQRFAGSLRLAALYSGLSIPVTMLKTAPIGFDRSAWVASASSAELTSALNHYYFWAGLFVFAAFVVLRRSAARLYAEALHEAIQDGALPTTALRPFEFEAFRAAGLDTTATRSDSGLILRAASAVTRFVWQPAAVGLLAAIWFTFVAQIYVSEFFNYHGLHGWLNQPLIQLPWFSYLPPGLGDGP